MDEVRRRRLLYRAAHRGFKEADLLLGGFAEKRLDSLTETQVAAFETLLAEPDQDIYAWIMGRAPTPPEFETDVMAMLRVFEPGAER